MGFRRLWLFVLALLLVPATALADEVSGEQPLDGGAATADVSGPPPPRVAPVNIKIPSLGVDADVFPVIEAADGSMDTPPTPDSVAWWSLGAGTGENGNVVLAAHVDWGGRLRVFGLLHTLTPGDRAVLVDEKLREYKYEVTSSHWVEAEGAPVEEIFASSGTSELTLITCGGQFDPSSRQYLQRLVVKAKQV